MTLLSPVSNAPSCGLVPEVVEWLVESNKPIAETLDALARISEPFARSHVVRKLFCVMPGSGATLLLNHLDQRARSYSLDVFRHDCKDDADEQSLIGLIKQASLSARPLVLVDNLDSVHDHGRRFIDLASACPLHASKSKECADTGAVSVVATCHTRVSKMNQHDSRSLRVVFGGDNDHRVALLDHPRAVELLVKLGVSDTARAQTMAELVRGHVGLLSAVAAYHGELIDLYTLAAHCTERSQSRDLLKRLRMFLGSDYQIGSRQGWLSDYGLTTPTEFSAPQFYDRCWSEMADDGGQWYCFDVFESGDFGDAVSNCRLNAAGPLHDGQFNDARALTDARREIERHLTTCSCAALLKAKELWPHVQTLRNVPTSAFDSPEVEDARFRLKHWLRGLLHDTMPPALFREFLSSLGALDADPATALCAAAPEAKYERCVRAPLAIITRLAQALRNPSDGAQYAEQDFRIEIDDAMIWLKFHGDFREPLPPLERTGQTALALRDLWEWAARNGNAATVSTTISGSGRDVRIGFSVAPSRNK
jgi:hypothetical protein